MSTPEAPSSEQLETFANQYSARDYTIEIVCPEFTSLCPKTGQPDFGTITFTYIPAERCVELKSLKLYLNGFRNEGHFCEGLAVRIRDDVAEALGLGATEVRVTLKQKARGGITVTAKS